MRSTRCRRWRRLAYSALAAAFLVVSCSGNQPSEARIKAILRQEAAIDSHLVFDLFRSGSIEDLLNNQSLSAVLLGILFRSPPTCNPLPAEPSSSSDLVIALPSLFSPLDLSVTLSSPRRRSVVKWLLSHRRFEGLVYLVQPSLSILQEDTMGRMEVSFSSDAATGTVWIQSPLGVNGPLPFTLQRRDGHWTVTRFGLRGWGQALVRDDAGVWHLKPHLDAPRRVGEMDEFDIRRAAQIKFGDDETWQQISSRFSPSRDSKSRLFQIVLDEQEVGIQSRPGPHYFTTGATWWSSQLLGRQPQICFDESAGTVIQVSTGEEMPLPVAKKEELATFVSVVVACDPGKVFWLSPAPTTKSGELRSVLRILLENRAGAVFLRTGLHRGVLLERPPVDPAPPGSPPDRN